MKTDATFYQQQQPQLQTLHYLAGRFGSGWGKKKKKKGVAQVRWFGEKDEEACNYSEGSLFHVGSDYHLSQRLSAVCQVCICSSVILQHNLQLLHVWDKNRVWRVCQGEVDALLGDSLPLAYSYFTHIMNNNVKADLNFSGSSGLWKAIIRPQVGSCSYFLKSAILNCIHTNYILSVSKCSWVEQQLKCSSVWPTTPQSVSVNDLYSYIICVCLMLLHAHSTMHSNTECQPTHRVLVYIMSSILTVVIDQCLMLNTPPTSAREHSWTDRWTDLFRKWFASVCSPQLTFNKALTNSTTLVTIIISQHLNVWHRVLQGRCVFQLDFWIMAENNLCDTSTSLWYLHIFCSAG